MAWTLHLLVGITVMAASAYKCKHTANSADADPRYRYDFGKPDAGYNPEPMSRLYNQMNARTNVPLQNDRDTVEERAQLRVEQTNRRSDQTSKVLSWKSQMETRRDSSYDNSKIVFPGLTSDAAPLQIPAHCRKLGICEDVANYPQDEVNKVIAQLDDLSSFQNDKLDLPDVPDITQRLGPQEENIELCSFNKTVVYPKAGMDANGQWHVVLNTDNNAPPLQGFKVEICQPDQGPCSDIAIIQPGYEARCVQKHVYRKMAVLFNGTKLERTLKVPSCCSCLAKFVIR